jgi:hypothetical protein
MSTLVRSAPVKASLRQRLTFANVASGLALFVALSGTASAAGYVINSNSQVGPSTIAGHHPPSGDAANVIAGTINGTDIQPGSIGAAQLAAPDAWRVVYPNPSASFGAGAGTDPCTGRTPVYSEFCGAGATSDSTPSQGWWENSGGSFAPAGFYRDAQQVVHLRGLVSWGHTGGILPESVPVFLLPTGYRPTHELVFTTLDNDSGGSYLVRIDIKPNGEVIPVNDDELRSTANPNGTLGCTFLSLDNISYRLFA